MKLSQKHSSPAIASPVELRQLRAGLTEAAVLYSGIPVTKVTTLAGAVQSLSDAVNGKNERKLLDAIGKLSNVCHQSIDRKFIVIGLPTGQPTTRGGIRVRLGERVQPSQSRDRATGE